MEEKQNPPISPSITIQRQTWKERNRYYHEDIESFVAANISEEHSVLEIGCGTGDLIHRLPSRFSVGMDCDETMRNDAWKRYAMHRFLVACAENLPFRRPFDRIIFSDILGFLPDVQKVFEELQPITSTNTRLIFTYYNYLWEPILKLAERIGLKMPQKTLNWLPLEDIENLLHLAGFEVVKKGYRLLLPKYIPFISTLVNRVVGKLPLFRRLCLVEWIIAKPFGKPKNPNTVSCSVIIPCRNERDNIAAAIARTPAMGSFTELIFVDGSSTDGTVEEIQRMQQENPQRKILLIPQGSGKGKGDAVRKGFEAANGDILMILDADLTVPPEDLPKFFNALVQGKGEFINGSRLVYPMEKQAMRLINLVGNKFFGLAFSYLLEQRFRDTLCGTKALWKKDYERIKQGRNYFGDFDPFGDFDLIFGASRQNLKIVEIPIRYKERIYGTTKIRRWVHGWLLLKMCWVATKKLKFAS